MDKTREAYERRIFSVLEEKENLGVPFSKLVKGAPCSAMKSFCEGLRADDLVGKLTLYAMNHGFDKKVKNLLEELAGVYKIAYGKNPKYTEAEKQYDAVKKQIERSGVLKTEFAFKDILFDHLTAAIEKTDALADETSEMFVPGLEERTAASKEAFLRLKTGLEAVLDWSSEKALERAREILRLIRIWNNVKIVACMTSATIATTENVVAPILETVKLAEKWSNAKFGVGKGNPRVKEEQLLALDFQDDQLKVWVEIHKKRKAE